jgi:predicted acyl esterase
MVLSAATRRRASANRWLRRGGVVLAASLFAVLPGVAATAETAPAPSYPGGKGWTPGAAAYGEVTETNRTVRVSDGTILKVDVTYPASKTTGLRLPGPFPVVLNQDPYTGGALSLVPSADEAPEPNYFTQHGYIYVHLHQRGTAGPGPNGSEGPQDLTFGPRMGLDGVEIAYWAADPTNVPGTNGKVGLQGCSALGVIQLSTLAALGELESEEDPTVYVPGRTAELPGRNVPVDPRTVPIKAALPSCFTHSLYLTQMTDNGVPTPQAAVSFLAPVAGAGIFGTDPANASSSLGPTTWSTDAMLGGDLGYNRDFWLRRDWLRRADDIGRTGVPLLMQVGYKESGFMSAQPLYAALQNYAAGRRGLAVAGPMGATQRPDPRYQVIIGNWGHGGGIDKGIELEWLDTWVRGENTGLQKARGSLMLQEIASDGSVRWISAPTFPISTDYRALRLGGGGTLGSATPAAGAGELLWPAGPAVDYTMAPFEEDTTLLAPTAAELWVQSSTTNVQLYVELQDVAPDGTVKPITHGSLLGSRSQVDPDRSWLAPNGHPMQPYLSLNDDTYLSANTPVKVEVPLQPVSWQLQTGHSLRISVAAHPGDRCVPQNPLSSPVPYGCMVSIAVGASLSGGVFQLLHDSAHPSLLNAALVPSSQVPVPATVAATPTSGTVTYPQDW